jgi:hypothetical protein
MIERLNYGLGAILVLIGALTQPQPIALGLAVGVALTCANFFVLRKLVTRWTHEVATGKRDGKAAMLMLPKMIVLMGLVAVSILLLPIEPIAFMVGYSTFILSIVIAYLYSALRAPAETNDG